jgi:RNA polymerase sigma factor (sigma-70 family)
MPPASTRPQQASSDPRGDRPARLAGHLLAARDGDRAALNAIVAELTPLLWQVARVTGLAAGACEDVVQTTWLHLLRELADIRDPYALTGWLVTVARREAVHAANLARRERPVVDDALDQPDAATADADEVLVRDERSRALWQALDQLPARCRDLLRLVAFVHRPDYDAVATALDMPRGSIGPTRGRCLAKLRENLATQAAWSWP